LTALISIDDEEEEGGHADEQDYMPNTMIQKVAASAVDTLPLSFIVF